VLTVVARTPEFISLLAFARPRLKVENPEAAGVAATVETEATAEDRRMLETIGVRRCRLVSFGGAGVDAEALEILAWDGESGPRRLRLAPSAAGFRMMVGGGPRPDEPGVSLVLFRRTNK
jgi:hypothetical protein